MKITLLLLLCSSILTSACQPATKTFKALDGLRRSLFDRYRAAPTHTLANDIRQVEQEIITHIQLNGYPAQVQAQSSAEGRLVKETIYSSIVVDSLVDGSVVRVFRIVNQQYVQVRTATGAEGYVSNAQFEPSLDDYPLRMLKTDYQTVLPDPYAEAPALDETTRNVRHNTETPPAAPAPTPKRKEAQPCPAARCKGTTQKGHRCRRKTTNCNRRCFQH